MKAKKKRGYTPSDLYTVDQNTRMDLHRDELARNKGREWVKLILTVPEISDLVIAMPLARAIHFGLTGTVRLYFARYTAPKPHIEYQIHWADGDMSKLPKLLRDYVRTFCRKAKMKRPEIDFEKTNGSMAHAMAFELALLLEDVNGESMSMVRDVTHWLYNMLGYTYLQEAESMSAQAYTCVLNFMGGKPTAAPTFVNPVLLQRRAQAAIDFKERMMGGESKKRVSRNGVKA